MPAPDTAQLSLPLEQSISADDNRHCLLLGEQRIEYTIRRSARRRSITLMIDEQGLRVGAPQRASQQRIVAVLNTHAAWVTRKMTEWHARRPAPFTWSAGAQLWVLGKTLTLIPDATQDSTRRHGDHLLLPAPANNSQAMARTAMEWLRLCAQEWFEQRAAHFAPILKVKMPLIRLSNARTRWGTCHPHGRVHLNWRLIHMPPSLIDYVVVHELAHLHEPNHSPRFWRRVEAVLPDHIERRKTLRTDSHRFLLP